MEDVYIRNLCASWGGQPALANVSLGIPAGVITAAMSPSGCVKTTFLFFLSRLRHRPEGPSVKRVAHRRRVCPA